ncbi:LysR family transcriptional regulator [uncultured Tateyamaria sp.]|uniref:LysR family transcriptional regulator n=1 Tax=Tateyamaria sp. 1078 TaxID=3417464 RepID=UPI00260ABA8D|nr:LysR family transcriptional regulator [uncultured Tateyamaria sp.]
MARALPPLTWFRSFEAAARHLNFTAAAQEIGLTQSAVSQQVRLLEQRLGVSLFARKARGLALTDDGRKLLPKVGASLGQLAEATAAFDTDHADDVLTVATSVSVARWIIAPHLSAFLDTHPGIRVRILSTIWPDDFKTPLADVEIRFGSATQVGRGAVQLGPDGLIAVRAPDGMDRLIETVGTSESWRDWAKAAGQSDLPAPSMFVDSYGAALDLAATGSGTALVSAWLARDAMRSGQLVQSNATRIDGTEGYFLARNADTPAATAFAKWIETLG